MKLGNKITKIISADSNRFVIKLKYANGASGEVELSDIFVNPKNLVAEIIKGDLFTQCFVENGALARPNGFEMCPDALLQRMNRKKRQAA